MKSKNNNKTLKFLVVTILNIFVKVNNIFARIKQLKNYKVDMREAPDLLVKNDGENNKNGIGDINIQMEIYFENEGFF